MKTALLVYKLIPNVNEDFILKHSLLSKNVYLRVKTAILRQKALF